ncbi:MAG: ATP-binding protein [Paludibacteraceae bacterium]|nr:ATP-binding protein [Paludibacteraceae bacterium]MBR6930953.1 ATP-binding protein [Bacteroidales bacterium]
MSKDLIKDIIIENQRFISSVSFHERDYAFEDALNYVLVGLRRAGKSYLLYQRIHQLLEKGHRMEEICYFNFEDDRLGIMTLADLDIIKSAYEEMFDTQPVFFFDEIQIVEGWEKFARRLADQKYRVYITGSNAKMLSSEIATTLGGRYMIKEVFPLSFAEYLSFLGINVKEKNALHLHRKEIVKHFETYFRFGGLPEVMNVADKRSWLSGLFNKVFFGDLIARYDIRNDFGLRILAKKLAESVKQPSSYNRLANVVSSTGKKTSTDTVIDYVNYMCESWLLLSLENIIGKLTERNTQRKYYFIDNGILNLFLPDPETSLLENMVAINLIRKYKNEVCFYHNGVEVDFYLPEQKKLLQTSYSLQDESTFQRETEALIKVSKRLEANDLMIITKDEETILEKDGKTIQVMPLWKWLLW